MKDQRSYFEGIKVAILVDGTFFIKRCNAVYKNRKGFDHNNIDDVIKCFREITQKHAENKFLYRIFYYDCFPLDKKAHYPISNKIIDFSKSPQSQFRLAFFEKLKSLRKVALRIGHLKDKNRWLIRPGVTKSLLQNKKSISDLQDNDVFYDIIQKGVDIRIGVDITSLAYKKLVNQIVLISGDSDFVPAAKVARREGIDFILDPMWNPINPALFEHIDGLQSYCPNPNAKADSTRGKAL